MPAKLIFYKEMVDFCPLMKWGCGQCFVPPKCKGEHDKQVAFNLREVKGHFVVTRIRNPKRRD